MTAAQRAAERIAYSENPVKLGGRLKSVSWIRLRANALYIIEEETAAERAAWEQREKQYREALVFVTDRCRRIAELPTGVDSYFKVAACGLVEEIYQGSRAALAEETPDAELYEKRLEALRELSELSEELGLDD